jgi:hypothetical protein
VAHYAEIDTDRNNVVLRVVVVDNKDTADAQGVEKEHIGAAYLERLLGGTWVQTSYSGKLRKHYAGIGYTYDTALDAFVPPQPYPSWTLDDDCNWQAPVPMPDDGEMYSWDEEAGNWVAVPKE